MATFDVRDLLGTIVYAKKDVMAYWDYPFSPRSFTIKKGLPIGVLYTAIHTKADPTTLWFDFQADPFYYTNADSMDNVYFVKYETDSFDQNKFIDQGVPDLKEKGSEVKTERTKEEKGAFVYYIEKWGGWILGTAAVVGVAAIVIKMKSGKQ